MNEPVITVLISYQISFQKPKSFIISIFPSFMSSFKNFILSYKSKFFHQMRILRNRYVIFFQITLNDFFLFSIQLILMSKKKII